MSLVRSDHSFDRSAIFRKAWSDFRDLGSKYQPFRVWLRKAWALAKAHRAGLADGSAARERQARAVRAAAQGAFLAALSPARQAAMDEAIAIQCATDGRLSEAATARLAELAGVG